LKELEDTASA